MEEPMEEIAAEAKEQQSTLRRVRFEETAAIHLSSALYITEDEVESLWYNSKELADISKQDKMLLRVARQYGLNSRSKDFCLRGLEVSFSRRSKIETRARKVSLLQAVLIEQHSQFANGISDPAKIRRKSVAASKSARQLAAQLARQDEREARAIQRADAPRFNRSQSCFDRRICMEKIHIDHSSRTIILWTLVYNAFVTNGLQKGILMCII